MHESMMNESKKNMDSRYQQGSAAGGGLLEILSSEQRSRNNQRRKTTGTSLDLNRNCENTPPISDRLLEESPGKQITTLKLRKLKTKIGYENGVNERSLRARSFASFHGKVFVLTQNEKS
ncbi:hypothetical protein KSP39_PZI015119 [Platanthera zijinensis]|uniref:Uncharacterized protein n=1 Tax=Platanthera zijinensis TaxID=2320716 RepID=A0AAP0G2D6_9ASPA